MKITPPSHLSAPARRWFKSMQTEYGITDSGGLSLLIAAAEAWQRAAEARALVSKAGCVVQDRFGQSVPHPAVKIERESRGQLLTALKALQLDIEPVKPPGRPARPTAWEGR